MSNHSPLGIALVGAGAFGEFCLHAFSELPEVRIVAVVDAAADRAERFARQYEAAAYTTLDDALHDDRVKVVALNTPPYLHGEQGLKVLQAGRHLFCEKPLALTAEEADQLIQSAASNNVRLTVDYVMRQNPFWAAAAALTQSGVLGRLRHMDLANHAAGLALPADHWFWDKRKSGGIWIEHGVHFFDAFSWVSGEQGRVIGAQSFTRSDGAVDRVEALLQYGDTAAHCYHGFDQSGATEQTTVHLTFEQGYITLHEWVPTMLELRTPQQPSQWQKFLPGDVTVQQSALHPHLYEARATAPEGKSTLYRRSIQQGLRDLVRAIRDPGSEMKVSGWHGLASLHTAIMAENYQPQPAV